MYEYKAKIVRVIDGDTVDIDIDLGFGVMIVKERVRIMGIDTPESRTRDKVEKLFGLASKVRLKELLGKGAKLVCKKYDAKGKFGRILGDFELEDGRLVTDIMISEGHCVAYFGGSKDDTQAAHKVNRTRLLAEGVVSQIEYDKLTKE
tara:strand:- start:593 stop:1036 length:444 start_codon:yes stop_codon:yes gene_type:complete